MSDTKIIPKEALSAYERWEMAVIDDPSTKTVTLTTANEVEHIQELAYREGYSTGYAEGMREVNEKARMLALLLNGITAARKKWSEEIEGDTLRLVMALSKQFLRRVLPAKPDLVSAVIREAIASLPWLELPPRLFLHPEDARIVRELMSEELAEGKWQIIEDALISRGGVKIETVLNTVDATLEGRWKHLLAAFDEPGAWEE
ncbi:MAG: flagellar assembly protein FliH [Pseudomonadota bacterium]|nr:flagellar assembly protein FliH [Pseudomonadota bacterium]